jgi:hypothetical protein
MTEENKQYVPPKIKYIFKLSNAVPLEQFYQLQDEHNELIEEYGKLKSLNNLLKINLAIAKTERKKRKKKVKKKVK